MLSTTLLTLLSAPLLTTSSQLDALKPRNWDLRLLAPGCKTNSSNIDISLYHRSGLYSTNCAALNTTLYDTDTVASISWKSPGATTYDLCMYDTGDCSSVVDVIRDGWEVCYLFDGWDGWRVVEGGEDCDYD